GGPARAPPCRVRRADLVGHGVLPRAGPEQQGKVRGGEESARGRLGGEGPLRLSGGGEEAARASQAEGAEGQGEGEGELTWRVKSAARNPKQGIVSCFGFRASDFSAPRPLAAPR